MEFIKFKKQKEAPSKSKEAVADVEEIENSDTDILDILGDGLKKAIQEKE